MAVFESCRIIGLLAPSNTCYILSYYVYQVIMEVVQLDILVRDKSAPFSIEAPWMQALTNRGRWMVAHYSMYWVMFLYRDLGYVCMYLCTHFT